MTTHQNLSPNCLYKALTETQLAQIQGGGAPHRDRPQDFTHEERPDFGEDIDLSALDLRRW